MYAHKLLSNVTRADWLTISINVFSYLKASQPFMSNPAAYFYIPITLRNRKQRLNLASLADIWKIAFKQKHMDF